MTNKPKECRGCNYEAEYKKPWDFHECGKEPNQPCDCCSTPDKQEMCKGECICHTPANPFINRAYPICENCGSNPIEVDWDRYVEIKEKHDPMYGGKGSTNTIILERQRITKILEAVAENRYVKWDTNQSSLEGNIAFAIKKIYEQI